MVGRHARTALLMVLPLLWLPAACGDGTDERAALEREELERELDMALRGDGRLDTFQDTALREPEPEPVATPSAPRSPAPAPRPATRPVESPPPPRPQPQPVTPPAPQPVPVVRTVPSGTSFAVRLNETLSTETNVAGDAFTTTLTDPIVAADGSVLIPAGAVVRGRVTAVSKSSHVGETAVIKLAFEAVSFGGKSYPLQATVVDANPERRQRTTTRQQAARVAAGAAAGALLGQVLGRDTESTVKGAVVGAAAGTAIAMGTADVDAVLPSGSRMVIRLDEPIRL